ncbi:MAG: hypothetical protein OER88_06665 [Planctomycetota bacterium]|nr:hypothetical protein [Planctomycetota bacterium]
MLDRPATNVGPYGWKLHLMTGGEYFHPYLDPEGGLLFYFYS